ncbi:MAG: efflux RND transporter periplasmic adaptor subunit [bacterium]
MNTTEAQVEEDQAQWQELASLSPVLKAGLGIYRHQYRGVTWFLLTDPLNGLHFRCSVDAYRLLMLLDGQTTVADAFQKISPAQDARTSLQVEVMRLFSLLHQSNLLQGGYFDADDEGHAPKKPVAKWAQVLMRPLAIPIPMLDPDHFLTWLISSIRVFFSKPVLLIWLSIIVWAVSQAAMSWPELVVHWNARFLDTQNLLLLLLVYPLVKALHELGHGLAVKNWGGEVHEMGILLLVFVPVPYVDASASNAFYKKHRRMLVDAAGIMVELFLAATAMLLWSDMDPGLIRDLCFNVLFIGGVSTVLFNGNPLLRFDGYYVLSDLLEIPNLASRSSQYLGYLLRRYVLGLELAKSPVTARGEKGWFICYGLLAGTYRIFISFSIAMLVASQYFIFGILLAAWFVFMQILLPFARSIYRLVPDIVHQGRLIRVGVIVLIFTGVLLNLLFARSFEHSSFAEGIVVVPKDSHIRAGINGFVRQVLVENGQWVEVGELLFRLENREISARINIAKARLQEQRARHSRALSLNKLKAAILKLELQEIQAELDELQRQNDEMDVVSLRSGRFTTRQASDSTGRYVAKGDLLGYVVDLSQVQARVVITQDQLDQVSHNTRYIDVRLASEASRLLRGELLQAVPLAIKQLPSRMLGSQSGGRIPVDARDQDGLMTMDPVFQLDIGLPSRSQGDYLGQSLVVRFVHFREPIADRLFQMLRGQVLERFDL